jgi:hypothetical protein
MLARGEAPPFGIEGLKSKSRDGPENRKERGEQRPLARPAGCAAPFFPAVGATGI